jgi:hypothetical protein
MFKVRGMGVRQFPVLKAHCKLPKISEFYDILVLAFRFCILRASAVAAESLVV